MAEAIRHAKTNPGESLGVATFSVSQRRAIQDELEALRRLNPDTEAFFHSHASEAFFVKNLENVQGDERDVIMISVGYAKNAQGYMAMRFGPLGSEGGERRLNVPISRAERRWKVYPLRSPPCHLPWASETRGAPASELAAGILQIVRDNLGATANEIVVGV